MKQLTTLFFICFISSFKLDASPSKNSSLSYAQALINTAPEKSLELTKRYLLQGNNQKKDEPLINNNEFEVTAKIPFNMVQAYLITAKSYARLGDKKSARNALTQAGQLINAFNINEASLELLLTEAILANELNKDNALALSLLDKVIKNIPIDKKNRSHYLNNIAFEAKFQRAIIASQSSNNKKTLSYFNKVQKEVENSGNLHFEVRYQIAMGKYLLHIKYYGRALAKLLSAYWLASENDYSIQISNANMALSQLYQEQNVLDKALQHANEAAKYYERYNLRRGLSNTQILLANVYNQQGRYNFALVHFFNALDIEKTLPELDNLAKINLLIARTYLKMKRYKKAQKYLDNTIEIAQSNKLTSILDETTILNGKLALLTGKIDISINLLNNALKKTKDNINKLEIFAILSKAYEQKGDLKKALDAQHHFAKLNRREESEQKIQQLSSFNYQHQNIERHLQFEYIKKKQTESVKSLIEQKKVNVILLALLCVLLLILLLRHRAAHQSAKQLASLRTDLYTHPRSGLRNLRMLNDKLSTSLAKSSAHFEQWYLGEMIHEPLSDKLSFAMFEVPFLKTIYLQLGHQQGLKLERQLGYYLKSHITEPARLYHFSDAMFVYIEPSEQTDDAPEQLAKKIQYYINEFIANSDSNFLNNELYIGMADYPFLPRALSSINDKKLIDILLMATSAARQATNSERCNQWVHLSAIASTPAACFANSSIRQACFENINKGLIKVKTSATMSINWQKVHDLDEKNDVTN